MNQKELCGCQSFPWCDHWSEPGFVLNPHVLQREAMVKIEARNWLAQVLALEKSTQEMISWTGADSFLLSWHFTAPFVGSRRIRNARPHVFELCKKPL